MGYAPSYITVTVKTQSFRFAHALGHTRKALAENSLYDSSKSTDLELNTKLADNGMTSRGFT